MKLLITSPNIVNAVDSSKADCPDELIWNNIFPMLVYPKTVDEVKTYINIELAVPKINGSTYKDVTIRIDIFTHINNQKTSSGYILTDYIQSEIDLLLNGSTEYGIGYLELVSVKPLHVSPNHYGSTLTYKDVNFNNSIR